MRLWSGLSLGLILLGGCVPEARVHDAAPARTQATAPIATAPVATAPVTAAPVAAAPVAAPAAPVAAVPTPARPGAVAIDPAALCRGRPGGEEARCLGAIARETSRPEPVDVDRLREGMKGVAVRLTRLDDPNRPVRCRESAADGRLITVCEPAPQP